MNQLDSDVRTVLLLPKSVNISLIDLSIYDYVYVCTGYMIGTVLYMNLPSSIITIERRTRDKKYGGKKKSQPRLTSLIGNKQR